MYLSLVRLAVSLILFFPFVAYSNVDALEQRTLTIAVTGINGESRKAYDQLAKGFEAKHPDVEIKFVVKTTKIFKKNLMTMLTEPGKIDIIAWHGGERLYKHVRQDLLVPITRMWESNNLDQSFSPSVKKLISYQHNVYAMPISRSMWGLLYKKSLFHQFELIPPKNWTDFVNTLDDFSAHGITPLALASKSPWFIAAWFEYINLRLNGEDFHQAFIKGEVPANSRKIRDVLTHFKSLIDKDYFLPSHKNYKFLDVLPLLYRSNVGYFLANSNIEIFLPDTMKSDIGFIEFPTMNLAIDNVQVSPLNIMMIPKAGKQHNLATNFLRYISLDENQKKLSSGLSQLPANIRTKPAKTSVLSIAGQLSATSNIINFYDREVDETYGVDHQKLWSDFLVTPDIDFTLMKMEEARQRLLERNK